MAIRYGKDGDIEIYDEKTGKTTGHISTMGNMIEETEEHRKRNRQLWKEALEANGMEYREE